MNKKFTAILTAMLCLTSPISAVAADIAIEAEDEVQYVYEASTFTYKTNNTLSDRTGFYLENDLVDPEGMVVGLIYGTEATPNYEVGELAGYFVAPINDRHLLLAGTGFVPVRVYTKYLGRTLQVGDLIDTSEDCGGFYPIETGDPNEPVWGEIEYLGNGVDIFGEEFKRVIRHQLVIEQSVLEINKKEWVEALNLDLIKGDVTVDDSVNVLDCIQINKSLLAGAPLCDYAKLAGDVNENGALDADDSLMILKETIGLTENFK